MNEIVVETVAIRAESTKLEKIEFVEGDRKAKKDRICTNCNKSIPKGSYYLSLLIRTKPGEIGIAEWKVCMGCRSKFLQVWNNMLAVLPLEVRDFSLNHQIDEAVTKAGLPKPHINSKLFR